MTNTISIKKVLYTNRMCNIHPDRTLDIRHRIGYRFEPMRKKVKSTVCWNAAIARVITLVGIVGTLIALSIIF